jgi:hypothetical protein
MQHEEKVNGELDSMVKIGKKEFDFNRTLLKKMNVVEEDKDLNEYIL